MANTRKKTAEKAPRTIARVAARRVFRKLGKQSGPVTLTIGVPQRVPGSDWACLVQITGLDVYAKRPQFIFGVDGAQALILAIQYSGAVLETCGYQLEWLGQTEDLGFPQFLPYLPTSADRERLDRLVDKEMKRAYAAAERRAAKKAAK